LGADRNNSEVRASVVIVTYNSRRLVERCLDALLPTLRLDDEVIVVDNDSSDGSADFIAQTYPMVRLVHSGWNRGYGGANNFAAGLSKAEYLVFLNPDTEPCAGWLDALLDVLMAHPDVGLSTAQLVLRADPDRIDAFGHDVHISGIVTCLGWGSPVGAFQRTQEVAAISGACFAIKRQVFADLGGFDERLFMYYEDDDLSLRARLAGYRCAAVPSSLVRHDHVPGFSADKLRYLERNRWWTTLKIYDRATLLALAPVLLAAEALAWGFAVRSSPRHVLAKARAWLEVLWWLPDLPRARRAVKRVAPERGLLLMHGSRLPFAQVASGTLAAAAEWMTAQAFRGARRLVAQSDPIHPNRRQMAEDVD
jgi:GT2 family glycosyltransferase